MLRAGLNAIVLWNTRHIDLAVNLLRAKGYPVRDKDAARLSPLAYAHINMLGRYSFPKPGDGPRLRPLRDPAKPGDRMRAKDIETLPRLRPCPVAPGRLRSTLAG
ncbi:hypothetical protein Vqi01_42750 [Micromonospora qiuiae]|uniref:Tn3 transposase DDE domain-containing protein n=1 Tax=Micromonospora qiuiae TaxID=502268 RepID=A0ABQ4JFJ3_9ACTN|nr:hypothetical protein Vqi01_42750 [Micromonospora qiuiae]